MGLSTTEKCQISFGVLSYWISKGKVGVIASYGPITRSNANFSILLTQRRRQDSQTYGIKTLYSVKFMGHVV